MDTMTDDTSKELTTTDAKPPKIDRRTQISPQLKAALDSMVEEGLQFDEAAVKQKMTVRAMRLALKRPNVIKYLREARHVFLTHVGAANIRRLRDLRDQDENRAAAVQAARTIEGLIEDTSAGGLGIGRPRSGWAIDLSGDEQRAGVVIVIQPPAARDPQQQPGAMIDVTPNDPER
jgi:hypothetical protein